MKKSKVSKLVGGCLFFIGLLGGCANEEYSRCSRDNRALRDEIVRLSDSLKGYKSYYHFGSIKPIVVKLKETEDSIVYSLYMTADRMLINDTLVDLSVRLNLGGTTVFSRKEGWDNLLKLSKYQTVDTLDLTYLFHSGKGVNNIGIPLKWTE